LKIDHQYIFKNKIVFEKSISILERTMVVNTLLNKKGFELVLE